MIETEEDAGFRRETKKDLGAHKAMTQRKTETEKVKRERERERKRKRKQ